jgi:hypothetical protein
MSSQTIMPNTIIHCKNVSCQLTFTIIAYSFNDRQCTVIDQCKTIDFTGKTQLFCPCCGMEIKSNE